MFLWWGPELVQFYNDAYIPSFGRGKHPTAMGQRGADCWPEIWPIIGPQIDDVMQRGIASWHRNQLVPIFRNGRIEDVYWTYGYSPARLEDGRIGGVLVVTTETTQDMLTHRRQGVLRALAEALAQQELGASEPASSLIPTLPPLGPDVPRIAALAWEQAAQAPQVLAAVPATAAQDAPLCQALAGRADVFEALTRGESAFLPGLVQVATDAAPEPVTDVALVPLRRAAGARLLVLAIGLYPRLPYDDDYRHFLQQLGEQLSTWLAGAESRRSRRQADEERLQLMLQAPVALAIMSGPEHVYTLVNPMYCRIVGRTEQSLLGKNYREAFPELIGTELPGRLRAAYDNDQRYASPEMPITLDMDGRGLTERWYQFSLEPTHDLLGRVNGLMVVATDVHDQVLARSALERSHAEHQRLLERAQDAARAKDEFLAMLGHELRNPLAPIVSALHVMAARGDTGGERERAVIERQVKQLTRLVDDLLDVARIARGRFRLEPTLARTAVLLTRAAEMTQPLMEQRGHRLDISLPPQPVLWWGDADRLVQVVTNLLTNAARYTPPQGHIRLSGRREGQELVIEVADNGIGIAPALLPDVFDVFYQGRHQGADRLHGGLGLGLALVKNLVALHEGRVEAHSAGPGQGSRFVVRLPLRAQPAALPDGWPSGAQAARQGQRVLLVDDNRDAVELLAESLVLQGHDLRVAYAPEQALAMAGKFLPQVAVLDVGLPGMDGHELARLLRARLGQDCTLVALSGYGQDGDRERAQAAGFAHYLVKPVEPARLLALIARIAAGRADAAP